MGWGAMKWAENAPKMGMEHFNPLTLLKYPEMKLDPP